MKISVIIPAYNVEQYIRNCVDMVLLQTYSNLEIILVDDGSTDSTGYICDEYAKKDSRVLVIHKANGGLSDARNAGTDIATGDYTIYLDSDDRWANHIFIESLVFLAERTNEDMIIYTQNRFSSNDNIPTTSNGNYSAIDFNESAIDTFKHLIRRQQFPTSAWSKMIKTSILQEHNIRFQIGLLGEDMDWNQRLLPHIQSISYCNNACYLYRERPNSITTSFHLKNEEDFCKILEHWQKHWQNSIDPDKAIYLSYLAYLYVTLVYRYLDLPKHDRKKVYPRIKKLASLLTYSDTKKSERLRLLQKYIGTDAMIHVASFIQHCRTKI